VVAAVAVLALGGFAAVKLMGNGHGTPARTAAAAASSAAGAAGRNGANSASSALLPAMAASPQVAVMPKSGHGAKSAKPVPSASHSHPSHTPRPSASPTSPSPSSSPTSPPTGGSGTCTHPAYTTSDPNGMWNQQPYFVANDAWNSNNYPVTQTLYACSFSNWYVVANMNNNNGDGAVKTFPNSHRDFDSNPQINSYHSITSTFAESGARAGIYEYAYDIWLNGIASSGSTEVMIWNENNGQTPSGSVQGTATFDGRTYTVWKANGYVAFVANANFSSGSLNLLAFFNWMMSKGWIGTSSTVDQVDYGVELVSTNSAPETFSFSNFAVNAS
jgi:hypothetical protein